jgi:hypothetical protein
MNREKHTYWQDGRCSYVGSKPTAVIQLRHCSIGLRIISSPADNPDGGDERSGVDRCRCDGLSAHSFWPLHEPKQKHLLQG